MTKTKQVTAKLTSMIIIRDQDVVDFTRGYISTLADQILKVCQEAGLAFVVEDAEIPRAEMPRYPIASKMKAYRYGAEDQCRLEARAGFRQTEEIEGR